MKVSPDEAMEASVGILRGLGVPEPSARLQADVLVDAELRGHPSHGLLRLPRIAARIVNGVADPVAEGRGTWVGRGLLAVDGDDGLGPVVAITAIDAIIERSRETGIAAASVRRSNHLGSLSWYVEYMAARGVIGLALTTSEALVHPWGGRTAMVGSNPIAAAVPAVPDPLVLDMATSEVSMGKIIDHAGRAEPIPLGWAVDERGRPTTDPRAAATGAISPFGGAKGYALGVTIEALVAALSGTAFGRDVRGTLDSDHPSSKGDLFLVIRHPEPEVAAQAVGRYLDDLRSSPRADPDVAVRAPGDGAAARRAASRNGTITVRDDLWRELTALRDRHRMPEEQCR